MKKALEAAIVISISILTVSTTATFIHNQAQQKRSVVAKSLKDKLSMGSHALTQQPAVPTISRTDNMSGTSVSPASSAPSDSSVMQNWSSQDTQRFLSITDKLVHSLTPQDWSNIEQALSQGSEKHAQIVLMTTAHKYLSPSDETWVATHLAGNKPFGPVDVSLLQQAFKQLEGQLTPVEQQILQENHLL